MKITNAQYITSSVEKSSIIQDEVPEIAFVGRSNVGKSSLINNLTNRKRLAKTSSTPGLTKMVNYFDINNGEVRFVDLPGYGYAKTSKNQKDIWSSLMADYLSFSQSLKLVFVLVDVRHKPSELDKMMISYLMQNALPFSIIATKADKLSQSQRSKSVKIICDELNVRKELIFVHSSESSFGRENILQLIEGLIE